MKNPAIIACCLLAMSSTSFAQKKPLDHSVYDDWQSARSVQISENGKYGTYLVNPQEGDGVLYINQLGTKKKTAIDRVSSYEITPNEKFFFGWMKPKFTLTKAHKLKKGKPDDAPKDTLLIASLPIHKIDTIADVKSYKKGLEGSRYFAYQPSDTTKTKSKKD